MKYQENEEDRTVAAVGTCKFDEILAKLAKPESKFDWSKKNMVTMSSEFDELSRSAMATTGEIALALSKLE